MDNDHKIDPKTTSGEELIAYCSKCEEMLGYLDFDKPRHLRPAQQKTCIKCDTPTEIMRLKHLFGDVWPPVAC